MTWTRLGDDFNDRPAVMSLSDSAFRAHIEALCWCNQQTTNGLVPGDPRTLRRILSADDVAVVVTELSKSGLWATVDEDYHLDWREQEPAERVQERKAYHAERQRRYRDRVERHARNDHSACDPRFCGNASRDASPKASVTATRPVPSRPEGTGTGTGVEAGPEQAQPVSTHRWDDDGSGASCTRCGLPRTHASHDADDDSGDADDGDLSHPFVGGPNPAICQGFWDQEAQLYTGCGLRRLHPLHKDFA